MLGKSPKLSLLSARFYIGNPDTKRRGFFFAHYPITAAFSPRINSAIIGNFTAKARQVSAAILAPHYSGNEPKLIP